MSRMPSRRLNVLVESLDGEAVLYDPSLGAVHRFDATTLTVWEACDGSRTMEEIANLLRLDHDLDRNSALSHAERAVAALISLDLLANTKTEIRPDKTQRMVPRVDASPGSLSRRELLSGGATKLVLAGPVVSTFFAKRRLCERAERRRHLRYRCQRRVQEHSLFLRGKQ